MAKFVILNHNVIIGGEVFLASDKIIAIDDSDFRVLSGMQKRGEFYITEVDEPVPEVAAAPKKPKPKPKPKRKPKRKPKV
tara:strand:+ start:353 stop:592 length:240 start_codon:yes stop_codon:yes gene_type:complete